MTVTPEQLAAEMLRRFAEERAAADQRAEQLRAAVRRWAHEAIAAGTIRRAWLIGSLAWGIFTQSSDVDLVVEGLDPKRETEVWAHLVESLHCEVDLLPLESLPESFATRVLEKGAKLE